MYLNDKIGGWGYKKFQTNEHKYIYDTYTNRVANVDENVYDLVDFIVRNKHSNNNKKVINIDTKEVIQHYQNDENMFRQLPFQEIKFSKTNLLKKWERNRLILNVTDDCNLRCKYCVFGDAFPRNYRPFSNTMMSFRTAKRSVDDFLKHSSGKVVISFYGGEPLLRYEFIKDIIGSVRSEYDECDRVDFCVTTNGSILTFDMLRYFLDNGIMLFISIDGPEYIHDKHRKYTNGEGTHKNIIKSLQAAKDYDTDRYRQLISFQATVNPDLMPVNEVLDYFASNSLFMSNLVKFNDMEIPENGFKFVTGSETFSESHYWSDVLRFASQNERTSITPKIRILLDYYIPHILFLYNRLSRKSDSNNEIPLNGCCVPGHSRLFVSSAGEYYLCEKIGEYSESIGNSQSGLDYAKALEIITRYQNISIDKCRNCWAMHLCGLCYTSLCDGSSKSFSVVDREEACTIERKKIKVDLVRLMELMEANPNFIQEYSEN